MHRPVPLVVVVSGTSGAGKSTLLAGIARRMSGLEIRVDSLYFDDFPFETDLAEGDIDAWIARGASPDEWRTLALEGRLVESRERATGPVADRTVILLEEPFGRARTTIRRLSDYSIHLSLPLHVALARRLLRQFVPSQGSLSEAAVDDLRTYLVRYLNVGSSFYSAVEAAALANADLVIDATLDPAAIVEEAMRAIVGRV